MIGYYTYDFINYIKTKEKKIKDNIKNNFTNYKYQFGVQRPIPPNPCEYIPFSFTLPEDLVHVKLILDPSSKSCQNL